MLLFVAASVEANVMFVLSLLVSGAVVASNATAQNNKGVPPGLVVSFNRDGSTSTQPDGASTFYAVTRGRLLKMRF